MAVFMHLLDVLTTPGIIFAAFAGVGDGLAAERHRIRCDVDFHAAR